jgi:hypothetical protein
MNDNGDRRSGTDRRGLALQVLSPDRRTGLKRRSPGDRRDGMDRRSVSGFRKIIRQGRRKALDELTSIML